MIVRENLDFERGKDPKEAMGIGRIVNILGKEEKTEYRALILYSLKNSKELEKRNPNSIDIGSMVFRAEIQNGNQKGEKFIVRKFDEPFGKFWGLEWNLNLELELGESLNFERGMDPKASMKIGLQKQIIKAIWGLTQEKGVGSINLMERSDRVCLRVEDYSTDADIFRKNVYKNFGTEFFSDIDQRNILKKGGSWRCTFHLVIKPKYWKVFKNAFTPEGIIKESLNFERGQEPKDAMEIGRVKERKQKLIAEITEYDSESWRGSSVLSDYIILHGLSNISWNISALEKASIEELRYALEYLKKWEQVEKKQAEQRLKNFIDSKKSNESLDFERGQEPKKAMNIGWGDFLIKNVQGLEHEGFTYDINDKEIAKIIKENIPEISDNELKRFMAFTLDDILDKISVIDFRKKDYKNITWYIKDQIVSQSRYWMSIHSDKSMKQAMRNSGIDI